MAERDHDHIYGVIRGTYENHGGKADSLTAPNGVAQADLILKLIRGRIDPRHVTYIEAHGTGTALGDPVEINALKKAFTSLLDNDTWLTPTALSALSKAISDTWNWRQEWLVSSKCFYS